MSDKNDILNLALEELLAVYLEGHLINKDVYGYWGILQRELFDTSILSFKKGLDRFYDAIAGSESPDLANYDIKLRVRLCNNEFIRAAANEVCHTFIDKVYNTLHTGVKFDFEIDELTKFEKILFLFFVYRDKIELSALSQQRSERTPERRRFSVNH